MPLFVVVDGGRDERLKRRSRQVGDREGMEELLGKSIRLIPDVFEHIYNGGKLRARFLGEEDPRDDFRPEAWIFSTNRAMTPGKENPPKKGYSRIETSSGDQFPLDLLLEAHPLETLGKAHFEKFGPKLGVLLKIFDVGADAKIPIHWHPAPEFAKAHLNSENGKNEAWIIIGIRDKGVAWIGWKTWISKGHLKRLIEASEIETIRSYMHEIHLNIGDALSLPAGTVHAIGSGVCVLEPQEPTDFSICAGWRRVSIEEGEAHLGLGWDLALDAADLKATSLYELRNIIASSSDIDYDSAGNRFRSLLAKELEQYFYVDRVAVATEARFHEESFHCITVLRGRGYLNGRYVRRGDSFFMPVASDYTVVQDGWDNLEFVRCFPPGKE